MKFRRLKSNEGATVTLSANFEVSQANAAQEILPAANLQGLDAIQLLARNQAAGSHLQLNLDLYVATRLVAVTT